METFQFHSINFSFLHEEIHGWISSSREIDTSSDPTIFHSSHFGHHWVLFDQNVFVHNQNYVFIQIYCSLFTFLARVFSDKCQMTSDRLSLRQHLTFPLTMSIRMKRGCSPAFCISFKIGVGRKVAREFIGGNLFNYRKMRDKKRNFLCEMHFIQAIQYDVIDSYFNSWWIFHITQG